MTALKSTVQWQTEYGKTIDVGDLRVTPQSQALVVRWPNGGWVWNRPTAVLVEQDGQVERIPVMDVTRIIQIGLLGISLFFLVTRILTSRKSKGDKS